MAYQRNLSQSARAGFVAVSLATRLISQISGRWKQGGVVNQEEMELITSGLASIYKALTPIPLSLSRGAAISLGEDFNLSEIAVVPKKDLPEGMKAVNITAFDFILEKALFWCNPCDMTDFKSCDLRAVFDKLGVAAYDEEAEDKCQYCIAKKSGIKLIYTVEDFIKFSIKHYNAEPDDSLIEEFKALKAFNIKYYEKNGVSQKILRKFMDYQLKESGV
jgi:hypothetical protein